VFICVFISLLGAIMNFEYYFDKILNFYNVSTIKELGLVIDTGASTISNWKQRNSITALKKKCRELGIYNEIFGDLNSSVNNFHNSNINKAFDLSSNSHSQDSINIGNNLICEQVLKMNQTIVSSFINVYDKLEKKGDLKRLHKILGEIEFE
jgi:hypothetical protein